jgi:23S rRNA (cytosine1962-C5)-methyltransferase
MLRGMSNYGSTDFPHAQVHTPGAPQRSRVSPGEAPVGVTPAPGPSRRGDEARRAGQRGGPQLGEPRVRRGSIRLPSEIAWRLRAGHPWVYRDTLGNRPLREAAGDVLELYEAEGDFIARGIYDPEGPIAVRVVTRDPNEPIDAKAVLRRVRAAQLLRTSLLEVTDRGTGSASPPVLDAYRVLHGEGDFLPGVTVDRYADFLVIHLYSAALEPLLPALGDALEEVYSPRSIYVQKRYRSLAGDGPREPAELLRGPAAPVEVEVVEYGLRFGVDVTAPLGTGLFPDLRLGRRAVAARSRGRRVLNLFSYTGALSMAAAIGGAAEVVSVDLSPKAHARARRNLQHSQMSESLHEFITGDVMSVMVRMAERRRRFDLVILDPPPFSQNRGQTMSAQRDYRELVATALNLCDPGALMCCASNAARFNLEEMMMEIGMGSGRAARHVRVVEQLGLPPDFPVPAGFPEGHYLKFLTCAVV